MYAQCRPFRGPRDKYSPVTCSLDEETNGTNIKALSRGERCFISVVCTDSLGKARHSQTHVVRLISPSIEPVN